MSIVSVYCKCLLQVSIVSVYCKCLLKASIVSIVSVYCKSLLRLFIVGVYCKYLLCFIVLSHLKKAKCEKAMVLLSFRSKMLLVECDLLCFRSHMYKKPYKTLLRIVFVHLNSPNHYIYRCKFLPYQKQYTLFDFDGKIRTK